MGPSDEAKRQNEMLIKNEGIISPSPGAKQPYSPNGNYYEIRNIYKLY